MKRYMVINGPNLNLLGEREPEKYGSTTLLELEQQLRALADELDVAVDFFQSNCEGALVDCLHGCRAYDGVVLNPGAYMINGYALRDAISSINTPVVEVHITNIHAREAFRHNSVLSAVCAGMISGLGIDVYALGLRALATRP